MILGMKLSIKTKIFLFAVQLVLTASVINIGIAGFAVQKNLTTDLINRIIVNTRAEIADLTNFVLIGDKEGIVNLIYNQKTSHKDLAYLLVIDENSSLLASTLIDKSPDSVIKSNVLPAGQKQQITLVTEQDGTQVYDIALRLDYDKGVLIAGYYKSQIDQSVRSIVYLLILGAAVSVALTLFLVFFFTRQFLKPLESLKDAVQKVAAGDLTVRAKVISTDEMGFLAQSFNQMSDSLQKSYGQLGQKVEEKTHELNTKVAELERFNKLMVDRELKMIELKKEIARLRGEKL